MWGIKILVDHNWYWLLDHKTNLKKRMIFDSEEQAKKEAQKQAKAHLYETLLILKIPKDKLHE